MQKSNKKLQGIAKVLSLSKSEDELIKLLDDLLTPSEIEKLHERIKIVACLKDAMSQRETQRKTNAGIATITRGARLLQKPKLVITKIISSAQNMNWWQKLFWRV